MSRVSSHYHLQYLPHLGIWRFPLQISSLGYISAMPIDGRARVLGMEFGVGDLLLRYDFLLFLKSSGNLDTYHMERTRIRKKVFIFHPD
jgi:hypothetical protein